MKTTRQKKTAKPRKPAKKKRMKATKVVDECYSLAHLFLRAKQDKTVYVQWNGDMYAVVDLSSPKPNPITTE